MGRTEDIAGHFPIKIYVLCAILAEKYQNYSSSSMFTGLSSLIPSVFSSPDGVSSSGIISFTHSRRSSFVREQKMAALFP
jgi:hypothetical protein